MRRNKLSPIKSKLNSVKKTKVQFSTRLSSCLGEHQSQEFFERLNITRQSGICSKNKNNSFGDNKSHSFRQTLQLNIPFIADLSDFKELCICYPVHFFRRKLHSYDSEDSRLASVRVYYPASRMKYGNEFKVSMDLKKRYHLQPHQYEFVAYSNLLTLSLEDLALAVFRAKSLSEKFKIVHSLPIPKILLSSNNFTSQIGTPIFIGTERIYSRLSKLIAFSKNTSFPLNNSFSTNSDSDLYLKKCVLKWVGLCDFLPLSSRLVFVRRVSGDSGDTLGCSILNSPGPKIRRSRIKEGDRLSIRLKQAKLECIENEDMKAKLLIEPTVQKIKNLNSRFQNNKRPRGRPKKSSDSQERTPLKFPDDNNNTNLAVISPNVTEEKVKPESLHLKTESISNSLIDSTSEEKYSVQLSTCSTPDTIKSRSPLALNGSITTTNSTAPISQVTMSVNDKSLIIKNKRGRPRKYPSNIQEDSNIRLTLSKNKSGNFEVLGKCQEIADTDDPVVSRKRSSNNSCSSEPDTKISRIVDHNSSLSDGDMVSQIHAHSVDPSNQSRKSHTTYYNGQCLNLLVHSMWKPLHHPLPPPEPIVPFIKLISSTGLNRTTQLNIKSSCVKQEKLTHNGDIDVTVNNNPHRQSSSCKTENFYQNLSKELSSLTSFKVGSEFVHDNNHLTSNHSKMNSKENIFSDEIDIFGSNQQYLLQNNIFNQLMMTPNPSLSHNNSNSNNSNSNINNNNNLGILSPYFNNVLNSHNNGSFSNLAPPVSVNLNSMFPSINTSNALQLPNLSLPSQLFYDTTAQLLFSNNSQMGGGYSQNPVLAACASLNHPAGLQHPTYNHILLANRFEPTNPDLSWNNGFQWKF